MARQPSHIFIVGLNRTGTNLLRTIINCSPDVAICDETHFLKHWVGYRGYQREFANVGNILTEDGTKLIVDYIYMIRDTAFRGMNFWKWIQRNIPREKFLQKLLNSNRNDHAILDVVMDLYANGKAIRGDKTPAHIHSVPTLLKWYPDAKIIHMLRDPRAIFVSEKRRQKIEYTTLPYRVMGRSDFLLDLFLSSFISITWLRITKLHFKYQQKYSHQYRLCKYEEMIGHSEIVIRDLCKWLEIDFNEKFLNQTFQNSSLVSRHKANGIDTEANDRWKKYLDPWVNKLIIFLTKKKLLHFEYEI